MKAADCARTFVLLAEGGVKVRWACGAEYVSKDEAAVDVAVLAANLPTHHRHHRPAKR